MKQKLETQARSAIAWRPIQTGADAWSRSRSTACSMLLLHEANTLYVVGLALHKITHSSFSADCPFYPSRDNRIHISLLQMTTNIMILAKTKSTMTNSIRWSSCVQKSRVVSVRLKQVTSTLTDARRLPLHITYCRLGGLATGLTLKCEDLCWHWYEMCYCLQKTLVGDLIH